MGYTTNGLIVLLLAFTYIYETSTFSIYPTSSSQATSVVSLNNGAVEAKASASSISNCCQLNQWSYDNILAVRQFSEKLRRLYHNMAHNKNIEYQANEWDENIINLTGKQSNDLDALIRGISDEIITDIRNGHIMYETIAQPGFFEWKASEILQKLNAEVSNVFTYKPGAQSLDLSNYDEVKNYAYPAEIKIIDGKTYIVHKNCTEPEPANNQQTTNVNKRNHTTITHPTFLSNYYVGTQPNIQGTIVTNQKSIYDWAAQNLEPEVINYRPVVNIDAQWLYKPPVHIPISDNIYQPASTVTFQRFNKTIITNSDGTNTISGSQSNKKWINGQLVYDSHQPIGFDNIQSNTFDDMWKRAERERLFWFFTRNTATPQKLEEWQQQQEERLLAMSKQYHKSLEEIQLWHQQELERYKTHMEQFKLLSNNASPWQRKECGRLSWFIQQNGVTREELERWQRENQARLAQLARQYRITLDELITWQQDELQRYHFNINNNIDASSLRISEQSRLEELIRQHNETIANLQNSIKSDQLKLKELSVKYQGNVQDMEQWLKIELERLKGIIHQQHDEVARLTEWQSFERNRLEQVLKQHKGSINDLELQMTRDRDHMSALALKYHVSIEELENWQRTELARLQAQGQTEIERNIQDWQLHIRNHLQNTIKQNNISIEELQLMISSDRQRLEDLARVYRIQYTEIEDWIKNEIKNFQSQGLLKQVEEKLALWQVKERERLLAIVQQNDISIEELEKKLKSDQLHLLDLNRTYKVRFDEFEEWLRKELLRLQGEGLIKVEELKEWQKLEREQILKIVHDNKLTLEEFEKILLQDRQRLEKLARDYNVQTSEIEVWIKKEGERLQNLGLLQIQEKLENWQKIERERILNLVTQNNLSIEDLEEKIRKDQVHLYSLAHQHQVRVEEIEEWIKQEIEKLQKEGLIEMGKLKNWQLEWRSNLTNMVEERDFTVEEFHKWLLEDRSRLQTLAMQHNVQIEEIEQWIHNEEQRFISLGLLKPNEKLTNWQEIERRYLERIIQEQYHSTEQLEERLRQDRELLEKLARDYSIQVEEIESWMKKELTRLRDQGQLQIDNLTAWQIAERERLEELIKQNKQWSIEEFEAALRNDSQHMQKIAFQYHTSVEEIEKWIVSEVERLRQQGKLNIEQLTLWQKEERKRLLALLEQQANITIEEFERKVRQDRLHLITMAKQYHISVIEVENYIKKVIEDLRQKGQFEMEKLQAWQIVERNYIQQLIQEFENQLSTQEYEQKLLSDRAHLNQLANHYHISVENIEKWMISELRRLLSVSNHELEQLAAWQKSEISRIKDMIRQNSKLTYVDYEFELINKRKYLENLARENHMSVEAIERWLKEQLLNLKTTGQVQVESLTKWQEAEQRRLIQYLLDLQHELTYEELELKIQRDRSHLQQLSTQYSVSVEKIEEWMRQELQRLKSSGLLQVQQLTQWQKLERARLLEWLQRQNDRATYDELEQFLRRDSERLKSIAQEYHITVEEIESWIRKEGARMRILDQIQCPSKIIDTTMEKLWKEQTKNHLIAIAQVKPMNWQQFQQYLINERLRWEQFARQYHITVEDIEIWLRQVAQQLVREGVISSTSTIKEWEIIETQYVQNLINDKLRKQQQQWSIEEFERYLRNDQKHLQNLVAKYNLEIENLYEWYRQHLKNLLNQRKIVSEHLVDWQRREKERIYTIVKQQPSIHMQALEELLLHDRTLLARYAQEYRITVEELIFWTRGELKRLVNLKLILDLHDQVNTKDWQQQERERLHTIAADIQVSEVELLEFIAADHFYQQKLASIYGCRLEQLVPFQRVEISIMRRENLLDNTILLTPTQWQKRERDRIYGFIKNQNFNLRNLRDWQRKDNFIDELAFKYNISVVELKNWQIQEFQRLLKLAEHYRMTIKQLQDYRDRELQYFVYVMHKKTSSETERISWGANEEKRMRELAQMSGNLYGEELLIWRRKLYLLCQGLLPFDYDNNGGYEFDNGSTNQTHQQQHLISKDRGDQPPNIFDENYDLDEPGVAGEVPSASYVRHPTTTQRPSSYQYIPDSDYGYRYSKKEYKFTGPVGLDIDVDDKTTHHMQSDSLVVDDDGGQQQLQLNQYDFDRQQQQQLLDFGQQQQQEEEFGEYNTQQQMQQEQIDFGKQLENSQNNYNEKLIDVAPQTVKSEIEVQAVTEPTSLWGKFKKKTTNIFG